jgi:hypothetical protein
VNKYAVIARSLTCRVIHSYLPDLIKRTFLRVRTLHSEQRTRSLHSAKGMMVIYSGTKLVSTTL